jgi:hypothetical protein
MQAHFLIDLYALPGRSGISVIPTCEAHHDRVRSAPSQHTSETLEFCTSAENSRVCSHFQPRNTPEPVCGALKKRRPVEQLPVSS